MACLFSTRRTVDSKQFVYRTSKMAARHPIATAQSADNAQLKEKFANFINKSPCLRELFFKVIKFLQANHDTPIPDHTRKFLKRVLCISGTEMERLIEWTQHTSSVFKYFYTTSLSDLLTDLGYRGFDNVPVQLFRYTEDDIHSYLQNQSAGCNYLGTINLYATQDSLETWPVLNHLAMQWLFKQSYLDFDRKILYETIKNELQHNRLNFPLLILNKIENKQFENLNLDEFIRNFMPILLELPEDKITQAHQDYMMFLLKNIPDERFLVFIPQDDSLDTAFKYHALLSCVLRLFPQRYLSSMPDALELTLKQYSQENSVNSSHICLRRLSKLLACMEKEKNIPSGLQQKIISQLSLILIKSLEKKDQIIANRLLVSKQLIKQIDEDSLLEALDLALTCEKYPDILVGVVDIVVMESDRIDLENKFGFTLCDVLRYGIKHNIINDLFENKENFWEVIFIQKCKLVVLEYENDRPIDETLFVRATMPLQEKLASFLKQLYCIDIEDQRKTRELVTKWFDTRFTVEFESYLKNQVRITQRHNDEEWNAVVIRTYCVPMLQGNGYQKLLKSYEHLENMLNFSDFSKHLFHELNNRPLARAEDLEDSESEEDSVTSMFPNNWSDLLTNNWSTLFLKILNFLRNDNVFIEFLGKFLEYSCFCITPKYIKTEKLDALFKSGLIRKVQYPVFIDFYSYTYGDIYEYILSDSLIFMKHKDALVKKSFSLYINLFCSRIPNLDKNSKLYEDFCSELPFESFVSYACCTNNLDMLVQLNEHIKQHVSIQNTWLQNELIPCIQLACYQGYLDIVRYLYDMFPQLGSMLSSSVTEMLLSTIQILLAQRKQGWATLSEVGIDQLLLTIMRARNRESFQFNTFHHLPTLENPVDILALIENRFKICELLLYRIQNDISTADKQTLLNAAWNVSWQVSENGKLGLQKYPQVEQHLEKCLQDLRKTLLDPKRLQRAALAFAYALNPSTAESSSLSVLENFYRHPIQDRNVLKLIGDFMGTRTGKPLQVPDKDDAVIEFV